MVKYGLQFQNGLAGLSTKSRAWAHVDYIYYKGAIKTMLSLCENEPQRRLLQIGPLPDFAGECVDEVRTLDDTFRRSLLADIADVDASFTSQCLALREHVDLADVMLRLEGRETLLELHRWAILNYLAVLKIVKKHDKAGVLRPLRVEVVACLSKCGFVQVRGHGHGHVHASASVAPYRCVGMGMGMGMPEQVWLHRHLSNCDSSACK